MSGDVVHDGEQAEPKRPIRSWRDVITVESPVYVEMTDAQRRAAVAAFTDILARWWQQQGGVENASAPVAAEVSPPEDHP
jgi:hypothetical protein